MTTTFATYEESQFERYYPEVFAEEAEAALNHNGQERRDAKKALLDKVRVWLDEDRERAEDALMKSAKEIIDDLKLIASQLKGS